MKIIIKQIYYIPVYVLQLSGGQVIVTSKIFLTTHPKNRFPHFGGNTAQTEISWLMIITHIPPYILGPFLQNFFIP